MKLNRYHISDGSLSVPDVSPQMFYYSERDFYRHNG